MTVDVRDGDVRDEHHDLTNLHDETTACIIHEYYRADAPTMPTYNLCPYVG